jgi:hypothetical protein
MLVTHLGWLVARFDSGLALDLPLELPGRRQARLI